MIGQQPPASPRPQRGRSGITGDDEVLAGITGVLAVVAHPDDESFGLGAILSMLTGGGAEAAVLCFTHGEASTLRGGDGDLGRIRAAELAAAGVALGLTHTELLAYPDGGLDRVPVAELAGHVRRLASRLRPTHLLVFDLGGVTGHPDHVRATQAALAAGLDLPVLAWTLSGAVAATLNDEFGTRFVGHPGGRRLAVDRTAQLAAIACHRSQAVGNPVLWRRLELSGDTEHLRPLTPRTLRATTAEG